MKRYPLDLIEWPMSNAHRIDLIPMGDHREGPPKIGSRVDGHAFPIDERQETYWDWDAWTLTSNGDGTRLRPGFHYLLAYYLGRYHGFVEGARRSFQNRLTPTSSGNRIKTLRTASDVEQRNGWGLMLRCRGPKVL